MNINFRIVRSRINKKGQSPIYLRLTLDKCRTEINLGHSIASEFWSSSYQRAVPKAPDADQINDFLDISKSNLLRIHNELMSSGLKFHVEEVKKRFENKQPVQITLTKLIRHHLDQFHALIATESHSIGRYRRLEVFARKITSFIEKVYKFNDLPLEKLNAGFISDFEFYLKSQEKLGVNTAAIYLKILKMLGKIAVTKSWLIKDPFLGFKCKSKKVDREYLSKDEINTISNKIFHSERLSMVRDVFIFCCYTGLSFSDVQKLSEENIVKGMDDGLWINILRTKTNEPCRIPLLIPAIDILKKYDQHPECLYFKKLLPVRSNQKMNEYLREISSLCGINKIVTCHVARHTFATTILMNNGMPIEVVSKMLGHTNLRTTQIYARISDRRASVEMNAIQRNLNQNI